jgi:hypothetical protein
VLGAVDTHGLTPVALVKEVCIYLEGSAGSLTYLLEVYQRPPRDGTHSSQNAQRRPSRCVGWSSGASCGPGLSPRYGCRPPWGHSDDVIGAAPGSGHTSLGSRHGRFQVAI